ncbi:unnamed protein product [Triticum turgidum subsp. durum]|uniref:Uncharacterized protein n=1 Tax=Triticum turgidum subsp. durum TaxID=4567 RepID=A0A9R1NY57_TRITD|nr:unnamed protein product [Triticum turgidum subsp. durum]
MQLQEVIILVYFKKLTSIIHVCKNQTPSNANPDSLIYCSSAYVGKVEVVYGLRYSDINEPGSLTWKYETDYNSEPHESGGKMVKCKGPLIGVENPWHVDMHNMACFACLNLHCNSLDSLLIIPEVKDAVTSLQAKKAISKKKKQRSRQKKLKAYDLSALSEFLPQTASSQQQTEVKLNRKSKQALVQRESAQLNAVLNNAQFQLDPLAAIHQHLVSTQPPSSVKDDESAKSGKKSRKDKKRKKKKKKNNALSTPQSMDI